MTEKNYSSLKSGEFFYYADVKNGHGTPCPYDIKRNGFYAVPLIINSVLLRSHRFYLHRRV